MTILEQFRRDEARVLDRLVDGELNDAERRALLAALDDEPGAWRRCALAFLEAQAWRGPLAQLAAEPQPVRVEPKPVAPARGRFRFLGNCLAVAAGLLVAFGIGTQVALRPESGEPVVASAAIDPTSAQVAQQEPALPVEHESESAVSEAASPEPAELATEEASSPWRTLTLAAAEAADAEEGIEIRVVDSDSAYDDALQAGESALPETLLKQLEREGWQIRRQERWLPIDLTDGRRLIVPVEEVDIRASESSTQL